MSENAGEGRGEGREHEWRVERVLVALDASPASAAAAAGAAELAAALSTGLAGLFVEDPALSRLAELPGAAEVGTHTGAARSLSAPELARRLRAQAGRARRLLERTAARVDLEATLEVVHGSVTVEVAAAAGELELLSLGRVGTSALSRLGSVARAALAAGRGPLLLLPPGGRLVPPLVVVYGDTATARRALAAAVRLTAIIGSGRGQPELVVLLPADPDAGWLENEARNRLLEAGITARVRRVPASEHHALQHATAAEGAGLLVLPAHSSLASGEEIEAVVELLSRAVLLIR